MRCSPLAISTRAAAAHSHIIARMLAVAFLCLRVLCQGTAAHASTATLLATASAANLFQHPQGLGRSRRLQHGKGARPTKAPAKVPAAKTDSRGIEAQLDTLFRGCIPNATTKNAGRVLWERWTSSDAYVELVATKILL